MRQMVGVPLRQTRRRRIIVSFVRASRIEDDALPIGFDDSEYPAGLEYPPHLLNHQGRSMTMLNGAVGAHTIKCLARKDHMMCVTLKDKDIGVFTHTRGLARFANQIHVVIQPNDSALLANKRSQTWQI